jgi:hypothetical protein
MSPFSKKDDVNDIPEPVKNEESNKFILPESSSSSANSKNNEKYNIKYIGNKDEFERN